MLTEGNATILKGFFQEARRLSALALERERAARQELATRLPPFEAFGTRIFVRVAPEEDWRQAFAA